jgi:putative acetyltransferase
VSGALRTYVAADEDAAIELWRRSWQAAYPHIDFTARLSWWRARWKELASTCIVMVVEAVGSAEAVPQVIGFVTVDAQAGYLDQIVVAPEMWGSAVAGKLIDAAKRVAPGGLDLHVNKDNARAIHFYEKHGFAVTGSEVNPRSGAPTYRMSSRVPTVAST